MLDGGATFCGGAASTLRVVRCLNDVSIFPLCKFEVPISAKLLSARQSVVVISPTEARRSRRADCEPSPSCEAVSLSLRLLELGAVERSGLYMRYDQRSMDERKTYLDYFESFEPVWQQISS